MTNNMFLQCENCLTDTEIEKDKENLFKEFLLEFEAEVKCYLREKDEFHDFAGLKCLKDRNKGQ